MSEYSQRVQGPRTPTIVPTIIAEDENDPVPLYFLDDDLDYTGAGIEDDRCLRPSPPVVSHRSLGTPSTLPAPKKMQTRTSAIRQQQNQQRQQQQSQSSQSQSKLVRFLDRVEIVPAPVFYYLSSPPNSPRTPSPPAFRHKKQKLCSGLNSPPPSPNCLSKYDSFVAAGLGRAGSPNAHTDGLLSPPPSPPGPTSPPSWRIPQSALTGRQPHVHEPPRVRSPTRADQEVDLGVHQMSSRAGVSYVHPAPASSHHAHQVIARKLWPSGEVRFEDQWGHRLIPVVDDDEEGKRRRRGSFRFDLWPVEEEGVGVMGN